MCYASDFYNSLEFNQKKISHRRTLAMASTKQTLFQKIPAVDRLLLSPEITDAAAIYPRNLILTAINKVLDDIRTKIQKEYITEEDPALLMETVAGLITEKLAMISEPSLKAVINATGVVIHTNLGRSILPKNALQKFRPVAGGYSNLEYDLVQGERGSRYTHVENILIELTSAEAAMVVNNNAAAVLVALNTLAKGREVVVSRGQLVEIGGSFRIPDVMRKSGAKMVEVGTTNKTHLRDYKEVMGPETALILKVHTSNFHIVGFTASPNVSELRDLASQHGVPVMEDLGSGCLIDLSGYGLIKEPTVQEVLAQGADLVTFSGDKLLGGPQAGIILGRKDLVDAIKENQLSRALRIDKLTLSALEETLRIYRDEKKAVKEIPTLKMICQDYGSLAKKARRLLKLVGEVNGRNFSVELADGSSKVGGGALPLLEIPTRLLCLVPGVLPSQFMERWLRALKPPVITRLEKNRVLFDVRTIQDGDMKTTAQAIQDLARLDSEATG